MREKCARAEEDARGQGEYFSSLLGWSSLVIWECELRDPLKVMFKTLMFLEDESCL